MTKSSALIVALTALMLTANVPQAEAAVIYCKYIGVPKGCVARAGVVLVAAPVVVRGVGAPGVGVRPGTPMNRGGPVNRVGRR
jgi:hypothetical protein